MKLHRLNEELEPQAPEGTVLIGWKIPGPPHLNVKYVNDIRKNIRDALGPLSDIPKTENVKILLSDSNLILRGKFHYMRFKEKVALKWIGDLLVVDKNKLISKFEKLLNPK